MKNVLIAGRYSSLVQQLADRFIKENWRVFTLSRGKEAPPHVFQHYTTDQEAGNLRYVLESCKPGVIIYAGAFDHDFFSDDAKSVQQRYVSYVNTLLTEAGNHSVQRFVYLSSGDVFSDSFVTKIDEDCKPDTNTEKGMLIHMGEVVAAEFAGSTPMDVVTLRMAEMYGVPMTMADCGEGITAKCLQAMRVVPVRIRSRRSYNTIGVPDAAEAVLRISVAKEHSRQLYNVASSAIVTDNEVLDAIRARVDHAVQVQDGTLGLDSQRVLDGSRFAEEFDFTCRSDAYRTVEDIVQSIRTNLRVFTPENPEGEKSIVSRIAHNGVAIVETVLAVLLCFFLSKYTASSPVTSGLNLYLLCSLLFGTFYGTKIGILAATLSTVCYLIGMAGSSGGLAMIIDVSVYVWIAQLFIVTLAVGYVRDTLNQTRREHDGEVAFLQNKLTDLSEINKSNVRIKDYVMDRMVDSRESVGYIYRIMSILDKANRNSVIFEAVKIITQMMGTNDVAIYRYQGNGYLRVVASTGEVARQLGKSVKLDDYPAVFNMLSSKKLYVNRSLTPGLPSMAGVLQDVNQEPSFAVLLWNVDYEHMTLYNANMLRVICELISNAVVRAADYLEAVQSTRVIEGTGLMNSTAFEEICTVFDAARKDGLADFCLLEMPTKKRPVGEVDALLGSLLRNTDIRALSDKNTIRVLLNNTNLTEALVVVERLRAAGLEVRMIM